MWLNPTPSPQLPSNNIFPLLAKQALIAESCERRISIVSNHSVANRRDSIASRIAQASIGYSLTERALCCYLALPRSEAVELQTKQQCQK